MQRRSANKPHEDSIQATSSCIAIVVAATMLEVLEESSPLFFLVLYHFYFPGGSVVSFPLNVEEVALPNIWFKVAGVDSVESTI